MKIPKKPPNTDQILEVIMNNKNLSLLNKMFSKASPVDNKGRYSHWDKIFYLEPPKELSSQEWWLTIKMARKSLYKTLPINNYKLGDLNYAITDKILEELHFLDQNAAGSLTIDKPILNTQLKNTYVVRSLIEESITSSQLEGAATTRRIAKKMIQENRKPRDKSEQMIYNNFIAMNFIREVKNESLTPQMIKELQRILTDKTLKEDSHAGTYRTKDDKVFVVDKDSGLTLFTPPNAEEIEHRIKQLCNFANNIESNDIFIHPVIRSIIIHFLMSYTHPFVDGNGRTARALFYWSMLRYGYWLTEFISISNIIKQSPAKYAYSFLYTETDENDLTYFIDYQLEVIHKAIEGFRKYANKKINEIESTEKILKKSKSLRRDLNHRQYSLIRHALKHPGYIYTINEHMNIHGIVYETARRDLIYLADSLDMIIKIKNGKSFQFISPMDLKKRIEDR